jgi:hypothetical protein
MTTDAVLAPPGLKTYITEQEYYMGRDVRFKQELSDAHKRSAKDLVEKVNKLLNMFGGDRAVTSGWRPGSINAATKGAAPNSKHVLCQAVDLADLDKGLMNWCMNNQDKLQQLGLWVEDGRYTPTWVHLQTVAPASGKRFFIPF